MKSDKKKYFNITLKEDDIITFDTNINQPNVLLEVIATANAATVDILTKATGRDDIIDILVKETASALETLKEMREDKGGETNESN